MKGVKSERFLDAIYFADMACGFMKNGIFKISKFLRNRIFKHYTIHQGNDQKRKKGWDMRESGLRS